MIGPTPLLDCFKRGEVDRDVKLLAAQGQLAPRAFEQLAILALLLDDADREIRGTAEETLGTIPSAKLESFLARADIPVDMREFFADRGVFPSDNPVAVDEDSPLIDTEPDEFANMMADVDESELDAPPSTQTLAAQPAAAASGASDTSETSDPALDDEKIFEEPKEGEEDNSRLSASQLLNKMSFPQRLKAAVKGTREMRAILIRDPNKMIAASVLASPKVSEAEVAAFAKMQNVSEDVLRIIANNRSWTKNYNVVLGLAKNPKTPAALSMNFLSRLTNKDVAMISVDRNVSEALRIAAKKKAAAARMGGG